MKPKLSGQTKRQERGNHDVSSVSDSIKPPLDKTSPLRRDGEGDDGDGDNDATESKSYRVPGSVPGPSLHFLTASSQSHQKQVSVWFPFHS